MARRTKLQIAEDRRRIAEAELAEAVATQTLQDIQREDYLEAFGELVPRREWPHVEFYDFDFGRLTSRPYTSIHDRSDGKFIPFYETETDLSRIRAQCRNLATFASTSIGAMESLGNYTLGEGFTFEVSGNPERSVPEGLITSVQAWLDNFLQENGLIARKDSAVTFDESGATDREIHDRSREDGEALIQLLPNNGHPLLDIREPDELTQPREARQLEEFMHLTGKWDGSFLPSWSFGVFSPKHRPSQPLWYHLVRDSVGEDWDLVPASHVVHIKRNVSRNAKRGISDYFPIVEDISDEAKLKGNTAKGGAIQAAIAFIVEHAPGATKSGAEAARNTRATTDYQKPVKGGSVKTYVEQIRPGTQKEIPAGKKYHPGPMGSSNAPTYIEIVQMISRSIGVRWNMPEYLISGDASNANYSSTLVSENPFVRARRSDQRFYKSAFCAIVIKAFRIAWAHGVFDKWRMTFEELMDLLVIQCNAPDIESTDETQTTTNNEILHRNRILSARTWASQASLDYEEEQDNLRGEPVPADQFSGIAAVGAAMESARSTQEARDILRQLEMF